MEIVVTLPNDFTTTQESSKHRNVVANWNGGSNDELYPPSVEETTSSWDSTSRTSEDDDDEVYSQSSHSKDSRTLGSEEDCPTTKSSSDCLMNVQTCSSSSSSLINKKVSFGTLQVRKYPFILGDHPDVNGGPPLTIGWDVMSSFTISVDEFEMKRSGSRRNLTRLRMLPMTRMHILLRSNQATAEEIEQATLQAYLCNGERMRSVQAFLFRDMLRRSVQRFFRLGRTPITTSPSKQVQAQTTPTTATKHHLPSIVE